MATNNLNAPIDEGYSSMPSVKNGADPSLLAATSSDMNLEVAADSYRHESEIEFQDVNLADRIISIDELDETDNTQTAPQTVAANDYAASSGLSRWKGIYNIVESVKEAEEEEEYEEEDAMVIVDTPMRTASPTHHHVKNTSFDKVKMAGSALKQKWSAKFREMPSLVPLLERLVVNEKKQSESNASSQTLSQQQQKPRPIDAPVPKVSSKRASSAGMMFLKSPAPIIAKFLGKEKHQQPPPQQQQLHHTPIKVDDVKGKTLSYVNRSNSSSVRSVEKLRATNVALAVSDEAPDFFSDELVKSGEEAKRQFESKYLELKKQLGTGGHSTVCLAKRISDNKPVVCKYMQHTSVWHWYRNSKTGAKLPLEIHLMQKFSALGYPGIIQYIEHFEICGKYIIIMEFMGEDWVDLYDYIEIFGPVQEDHAKEIFTKVVETVTYLHDMGFCHNDIKDENILINKHTREIKLIDFGSTTPLIPGKLCTLFYGTKKFAAPEAVSGEAYHPEAQESWSLGTLLYVLLFKMDPFKDDNEIVTLDIGKRIQRLRSTSRVNGGIDISDEASLALQCMMEKDWIDRTRPRDILLLPFFHR